MEGDKTIEQRKKKVLEYMKGNPSVLVWVFLILVIILSIYIRIQPMDINPQTGNPGLWDITTNTWTLGPDLDPFLFLRWAKDIDTHGSLMEIDTLRNVPLLYPTNKELILHSYLIAWFHKVASMFGSDSVTHSAIIYPVFMFALTIIAFFLFVRKIFIESVGNKKASSIALISSLFLAIIPELLPRTIAGIPEKEASGFLFIFLAFYLFISAWKSNSRKNSIILAISAGISTALMALVWGGVLYIFLTIALATMAMFLLGKIDKHKIILYACWLFTPLIIANQFTTRFSLSNIINSTNTIIPLGIFAILLFHLIIESTKLKEYRDRLNTKNIPTPLFTLIITFLVVLILVLILLGPSFIMDKVSDITRPLVQPISDRFGVTVAENRQPYFNEWAQTFGPLVKNIPLFFWIFIIGSIYFYWTMVSFLNKNERLIVTGGYILFILSLLFSRYSDTSTFNGVNGPSLIFYAIGILALIGTFGYYYFKYNSSEDKEKLKSIDAGLILLLALFFFSLVSARGAVRVIMVLVPAASIMATYLFVSVISKAREKDNKIMMVIAIFLVIVGLYAANSFYQTSFQRAQYYIPSEYNQQWQKAMSWVRENTSESAVFAHWWDYGYWLQSIGERATVLDGGNEIVYWDHLMGRYVLTGTNKGEALDFLYTHNTTHLLIDSTDIGKYPAFSSIGSDGNYDRYSWLNAFTRDPQKIQETKNSTVTLYTGGSLLDQDIVYELNGTKLFLPGQRSYVGGIITRWDKDNKLTSAPEGIFVYQTKQYNIPLRYAYYNGSLIDYGAGLNAGIFLMPTISQQSNGQMSIDMNGAMLYLSNRTVDSLFAKLYLFNQKDSNFRLAHTEEDSIVSYVKSQTTADIGNFIYLQGVRGPIKIWEINYLNSAHYDSKYLEREYPDKSYQTVK